MTVSIKDVLLKDKYCAIAFKDGLSEDILLDMAASALSYGIKIILFYDKTKTDEQNLKSAQKLRQLCSLYEGLFFIISRCDLAKLSDADGICLKSGDLTINQAKKFLDDSKFYAKYQTKTQDEFYLTQNDFDVVFVDEDNSESNKSILASENNPKIIKIVRHIK